MRSYDEILVAMKAEFEEKAGFSPDDASDIGIRLKVLASQIYSLGAELDWLKRQAFPQTATGEELDKHAEMRGVIRKGAKKAAGYVVFYRDEPAVSDIFIPAGTVCITNGQPLLRFLTVSDAIFPAGGWDLEVPVVAENAGTIFNVGSRAICALETPIEGIHGVTNDMPFYGGVNPESDEDLRRRLLQSFKVINGANSDFYKKEVLKFPEVRSANVAKHPRGTGTLDIYVTGYGVPLQQSKLNEIKAYLGTIREVSVDIEVKNAMYYYYNVTVNVTVDSGYSSEEVKGRVRKAIEDFFMVLEVGQPVILSKLGAAISAVEGVTDYTFVNMQNGQAYFNGVYVSGVIVVN